MRALVQRVTSASVTVADETVGAIEGGLLVLVCAMHEDDQSVAEKLAGKVAKLRIFRDDEGRMNKSLLDVGGAALVVSQFTLAADTSRGNRPGFSLAAPPELGDALVNTFGEQLSALGITVARGQFGADMQVALVNDGPVTIWLDTDA